MILRRLHSSTVLRARAWGRTLLMSLFLVACGGGVESGGTGGNASASYASGPITGFGSVIVGGVRFEDTSAAVTDADGEARSRDDLKLGMTITVRGTPIAVDGSSAATSIVFGSAIVGPVSAIDVNAATLTVLGQSVDVLPTTVFEESLGGALAALSVGDVLEVYALLDTATQRYNATRIERRAVALVYHLRGVVANLNTSARTFTVGSENISYAALSGSDVPAGLANGSIVRVILRSTALAGVRDALRLRLGVIAPHDFDDVRIEGLISAFTSSAVFSVDGVPVNAAQASFPDGTAGLGLGVRVALQGTVDNGVLNVSKVQIKSQAQVEIDGFELRGLVTGLDTAAQRFTLRGVSVDYSGPVDYRDGTQADLRALASVEVRGRLSLDGTRLVATRITFRR
ncbi:MAG: DUF5666 domain-containing protein [Burkholderiaceae bacterium]